MIQTTCASLDNEMEKRISAIQDIAIRIGSLSEGIVLICGHSTLFLAERYRVDLPTGIAFSTKSIDFIAIGISVLEIDDLISYHLDSSIVRLDKTSPSSGEITINVPSVGMVGINFLQFAAGVDRNILKSALSIKSNTGKTFRLISPIMLLKNRISRIAYSRKPKPEEIACARASVEIARHYLAEKYTNDASPDAEIDEIIHFAGSDAAAFVDEFHQINLLRALPLEKFSPHELRKIDHVVSQRLQQQMKSTRIPA